jgi:phage terminase small subunit
MRWERFAQLYAGSCFGNATRAYMEAGYKPKTDSATRAESSRLLANDNVSSRVSFLRKQMMASIGLDALQIMRGRMKIAFGADTSDGDRLRAFDALEKALGLNQPEKVEHSMAEGAVIRFISETRED